MSNVQGLNPEGYCPADETERWNQSIYFNFYDPNTTIGCFIRMGVLENLKQSNLWFTFFMDGKPLFVRNATHLPYTPQRMDKGIEINGVRIKALTPMKKAQVQFEFRDFAVDLIWDEIAPLEDCINLSSDDDGAFAKQIAQIHLEGVCKVTGTVRLRDGKKVEINGKGFRDIAVGTRNWDGLRHYRLTWPVFDDGTAVVAVHGQSMTRDHAYMKMVFDGKKWVGVKSVVDRQDYEADDMTLKSQSWSVTDVTGRVWNYRGRRLFVWHFPFDTFVLAEHMMEYTRDDGVKGYGLGECGYRFPWAGNGNETDAQSPEQVKAR